jgi:hypothetical protein
MAIRKIAKIKNTRKGFEESGLRKFFFGIGDTIWIGSDSKSSRPDRSNISLPDHFFNRFSIQQRPVCGRTSPKTVSLLARLKSDEANLATENDLKGSGISNDFQKYVPISLSNYSKVIASEAKQSDAKYRSG